MSAAIRYLRQHGLTVRPAGIGFAVSPKALITDGLREFIQAHKEDIKQELAGGGIHSAFQVLAAGKQFTMVIPGGSTREEAATEARLHWPDAEVIS